MGILKKITAVIFLVLALVFSMYFITKFKDIGNVYLFSNEKVVIIDSFVLEEPCVISSGRVGGGATRDAICFIPKISYYSEKYGKDYIGNNVDFFLWNNSDDRNKADRVIEKYKENSIHLAYFIVRDGKVYSWLNYNANFIQLFVVIIWIVSMYVFSYWLFKNK